jgi:hypothetical protein
VTQQSKLFKLLAAPSPLPESSESDINLSRYGERLLKQYIGGALESSLMPPSTLLSHYLHIPPPPNETPFEVPVIVKKNAASAVLGSFMEFRNPNRHKHLSLTERVTRTKQNGVIVVMSSNRSGARTDLCRHVHIHLKGLSDFDVPGIPVSYLEGVKSDDIGAAGEWSLYSQVGVDQIFSRYQTTKVEKPSRRVSYEVTGDDEAFLKELFVTTEGDYINEYLFRVAPVIKTATVVFCIPKLYNEPDFADAELAKEIGAGACVFYLDDEPDGNTLENLYVISHKLCGVASNIYDVARIISEKKVRKDSIDILGCIHHSLKNTLSKGIPSNSTPEMVGRILKLEEITISAASALTDMHEQNHPLDWATDGFEEEPLGTTIGSALSDHFFTLEINDDVLRDRAVDPRLAVIIIELGRNLSKRAPREPSRGEISVTLNPHNDRTVDVEMFTTCSLQEARTLYENLQTHTELRGISWIVKLASRMLDRPRGMVSWTFGYSNADIKEEIEKHQLTMKDCHVTGPSSIFVSSAVPKTEKLDMHFRAQGLSAILD